MTHVAHVITGLGAGGAEGFLTRLVPELAVRGVTSTVFSLTDDGVYGEELRRSGTDVCPLGLRPDRPDPRVLVRLVRHLGDIRPDVVMTWLYHADLIGGMAGRIARVPVGWNLRQSAMGPAAPRRHHMLLRLNARLADRLPAQIVCVSHRALADHIDAGYPAERMEVIHNGFDVARFKPDAGARLAVRGELGIPADGRVIGHVARFDAQKDHRTLIHAIALVFAERSDTHLVMCGDGLESSNRELGELIDDSGLDRRRLHLLGRRQDVARLDAAFDVAVSSSAYGEGLSNALAEAMACGVPCVSTDTGDAEELIGGTGTIVPVGDAGALAQSVMAILDRQVPPVDAVRRRILDKFELGVSADAYRTCLERVARGA